MHTAKFRAQSDKKILNDIQKQWGLFPGLGYKKLADYISHSKHTIQRVLQEWRGKKQVPRHKKKTKRRNIIKLITAALVIYPEKQTRENWVLRDGKNKYQKIIEPTRPYQLWVRDWKELRIPVIRITVYIFIILDVYTRKIYAGQVTLSKTTKASLTASKQALKQAQKDTLFNPRKMIIHQDNGSAYTAEEEEQLWRSYGVTISYSDPGKPTQNGYAEGFMSILSRFWLKWIEYETIEEARISIQEFITRYNEHWVHTKLEKLSPNERLESYRKSYLNI